MLYVPANIVNRYLIGNPGFTTSSVAVGSVH
jgi:hypothetical protein